MERSHPPPRAVRFGAFTVDLQAGELRKNGHRVKIQEQPFQVLAALLERPGEIVTQDELRQRIWPDDVFVDFEHSLRTAVLKLRDALGDSAENPRFIETRPRRGYRFIAPVEGVEQPYGPRIPKPYLWIVPLSATALLAAALALWWQSARISPTAQQKLPEGTTAVSDQPKFTKIRIPSELHEIPAGVLSPDGKKFAFTAGGSIWVVPIPGKVDPSIAGGPARLTEAMEGEVTDLAWSGDGACIAFNHFSDENGGIYVLPATGGEVKKVPLKTHRDAAQISLSADGKILAFVSTGEAGRGKLQQRRIYTVPVAGGVPKRLTDSFTVRPAFSPDGKRIAFLKIILRRPYEGDSELWVMPVEGGKPVLVMDAGRPHLKPVWSPDGKMIAFVSLPYESDKEEVWIVPVTSERRRAAAKFPLPRTAYGLAGWTADDKIGVVMERRRDIAIYTMPTTGGKPTQVTPTGPAFHPRWTPDGQRIVFRWGRGDLASVPAEGGEVTVILKRSDEKIVQATSGGGSAVSPDGKRIAFAGYKVGVEGVQIWTTPVEGGEPTQLTSAPTQSRFPCWSPDGKRIAFVRMERDHRDGSLVSNMYSVVAEGGAVRQLTTASDNVAWSTIAWSPDGKWLAYFSEDKAIRVIPTTGGRPRDVVKVGPIDPHSGLAWSPDGKKLAYTSQGRIFVASLDGGAPTPLPTGLDAWVLHLAWSPDGEKIAFSAAKGGRPELWLVENFLPPLKASK